MDIVPKSIFTFRATHVLALLLQCLICWHGHGKHIAHLSEMVFRLMLMASRFFPQKPF
jgi:hypothetical protein